jgi:Domain of unknown function (DUF1841)
MPFFDNQSRDDLRRVYVEAWRKRRAGLPVEPLEAQVADVIALHPEYHAALERGDETLAHDYTPEGGQSNPFLHMGLHLAVRDQIATDRPAGRGDVGGATLRPAAGRGRLPAARAAAVIDFPPASPPASNSP